MSLGVTLSVQCLLIVAASLLGGRLPDLIELTHRRMQVLISLIGGLMLGIAWFHMLPHAVSQLGSIDEACLWAMAGLLGIFFLLRTFHFHEHEPVAAAPPGVGIRDSGFGDGGVAGEDGGGGHAHGGQGHSHGGGGGDGHGHSHGEVAGGGHAHRRGAHRLSWTGVAFGLTIHTLIDGMALAASLRADAAHGVTPVLLGFGTFLAILLHKPLDAVSITSLMSAGGWTSGARLTVTTLFALACPAGAVLFLLGVERFSGIEQQVVGAALAFSAGVFVCIAMSDLLPEIEFHTHDRFKLSACLLAGVAVAYAIGFLEPEHLHEHGHEQEAAEPEPAVGAGDGQ